jgi:Tfp pilus assembly protein PilF
MAAMLVMASYYSYATYLSRYDFVLAKMGQKSQESYEALLRRSFQRDPSHGYANLELARMLIFQRKYGAARTFQEQGMESFRPMRAYEQMGTIAARLGDLEEAKRYFTYATLMFPNNVQAFEQLAFLAYEQKDSERLDTLIDEILRLDMLDLNAFYLRARDAERMGQTDSALLNYEFISAELSRVAVRSGRQLFDPQEIRSRLLELRKAQSAR